MDELIPKKIAVDALKAIKHGLWEIDIPSPGNCPEYREHHEQIKNMMEIVDLWIAKIKDIKMEEQDANGTRTLSDTLGRDSKADQDKG